MFKISKNINELIKYLIVLKRKYPLEQKKEIWIKKECLLIKMFKQMKKLLHIKQLKYDI